jgi:hypothetical protein
MARQIKDHACLELRLTQAPDRLAAETLRSFLESVGAKAIVEDA